MLSLIEIERKRNRLEFLYKVKHEYEDHLSLIERDGPEFKVAELSCVTSKFVQKLFIADSYSIPNNLIYQGIKEAIKIVQFDIDDIEKWFYDNGITIDNHIEMSKFEP